MNTKDIITISPGFRYAIIGNESQTLQILLGASRQMFIQNHSIGWLSSQSISLKHKGDFFSTVSSPSSSLMELVNIGETSIVIGVTKGFLHGKVLAVPFNSNSPGLFVTKNNFLASSSFFNICFKPPLRNVSHTRFYRTSYSSFFHFQFNSSRSNLFSEIDEDDSQAPNPPFFSFTQHPIPSLSSSPPSSSSSSGIVFLQASSQLLQRTLQPGESFIVQISCLVAFEDTLLSVSPFRLSSLTRPMSLLSYLTSLLYPFSGLEVPYSTNSSMVRLEGPGKVYFSSFTAPPKEETLLRDERDREPPHIRLAFSLIFLFVCTIGIRFIEKYF